MNRTRMFPKFNPMTSFILAMMFAAHAWAMGAGGSDAPSEESTPAGRSGETVLVVSGVVQDREEIWDRRPNPMMGRPDMLEEVVLTVRVERVLAGRLSADTGAIRIFIRGRERLIQYRMLNKGDRGTFHLRPRGDRYALEHVEDVKPGRDEPARQTAAKPTPGAIQPGERITYDPKARYTDDQIKDMLATPIRITAAMLRENRDLREKVARLVGAGHKLAEPSVIFKTSFSGPRPPKGGYRYWGVKGRLHGDWHVWQPGRKRLIRGDDLIDPKRTNKCLSPGTLIRTPAGQAAVKTLRVGDMVVGGDGRAASVVETLQMSAKNHVICRIHFDDGVKLEVSPSHPLAGGGTIGGLRAGQVLEGKQVVKTERVPYRHAYTYDILPDSPSGVYWANGVRLRSTLAK